MPVPSTKISIWHSGKTLYSWITSGKVFKGTYDYEYDDYDVFDDYDDNFDYYDDFNNYGDQGWTNNSVLFEFVFGWLFETEYYSYSYLGDFLKPNIIHIRIQVTCCR